MSEKLHQQERLESDHDTEPAHEVAHHHENRAERSPETPKHSVEEIEHKIDELKPSDSGEVKKRFESPKEDEHHHYPPSAEVLRVALSRSLSSIRSNLSGPQKTFSKIIHKPSIDNVSEFASKTFIRPSGILFGGVFTLLGSAYYLYAIKQTGFHYNFFVAIMLFVGGFIFGLLVEFCYNTIRNNSRT